MKTMADLLAEGERAARDGTPLMPNWPQVRGAIHLIGQITGGLDRVPLTDFETRFPVDYRALDPVARRSLPGRGAYSRARTQILRLLAGTGHIDAPWEALRVLLRLAGRSDLENPLAALSVPARKAGLAPADVSREWVISLIATQETATQAARLLRGVAVFNALFEIPEIAPSGVLPPSPIEMPTTRRARPKHALPARTAPRSPVLPLPPRFLAMATAEQDRWALRALWQLMCAHDMPDATPDELLRLSTWRCLSADRPEGIKPATWRAYSRRARRLLVRHARTPDPWKIVRGAWAALPAATKASLAPIRKPAEHAFLRPLDVCPEWVSKRRLDPAVERQVISALRQVFAAAVEIRKEPKPDPVAQAWADLRRAATSQASQTTGLWAVEKHAVAEGLAPSELTTDWAAQVSARLPGSRARAKFTAAVRLLRGWQGHPTLADLLPGKSLGPLPDLRRCTSLEPPAHMMRVLDVLAAAHGCADSTLREYRAVVRKIYAAARGAGATPDTLEALLRLSEDLAGLEGRTCRKATGLLKKLLSQERVAKASFAG